MHDSVRDFIAREAPYLRPAVLEVGAYDVNGGIRDLLPMPTTAYGIDIVAGPGVDEVYDGMILPTQSERRRTMLPPEYPFPLWGAVVSTEMFEHVNDPVNMAREMVRVCEPGGRILVTARGPGFAYHNPPDRWRFMPGALAELFDDLGCSVMEWPDPQVPGVFVRAITPLERA
jgi:SAM-dependent methyltransferase